MTVNIFPLLHSDFATGPGDPGDRDLRRVLPRASCVDAAQCGAVGAHGAAAGATPMLTVQPARITSTNHPRTDPSARAMRRQAYVGSGLQNRRDPPTTQNTPKYHRSLRNSIGNRKVNQTVREPSSGPSRNERADADEKQNTDVAGGWIFKGQQPCSK